MMECTTTRPRAFRTRRCYAMFVLVLGVQVMAFSTFGVPRRRTRPVSGAFVSSYCRGQGPYRDIHLCSSTSNDHNGVSGWNEIGEELDRLELEELTVSQLKQQLRLRGLRVSGRKQELIDRLMESSGKRDHGLEDIGSEMEADLVDKDDLPKKKSKARQFAEERGKEFIDVTAYLDEEDKGKEVLSSDQKEQKDEVSGDTTGPEVWGSQAKIVEDYEGRSVVVDNLSRTVVEFMGSNETEVKAFVVASRDALKAFLSGGDKVQNKTQSTEERLREIQMRREKAAKVPVRSLEDDPGLDEGDETGMYANIIERDFSDWGKYTQTGAQLSAQEVQGVILLSDVYGPFTEDTRALAEKIAFECQPVVVMAPDIFRDHPWAERASSGKNEQGQDYEQWRATHNDLRVNVDIRAAAACLRQRYGVSSIVVWGTCYGGGRALEAASGYVPRNSIHDINGKLGPPAVDPMAAVAWYPTRYEAEGLFGKGHRGSSEDEDGSPRKVAVMCVFAGEDSIAGATPDDAAKLKSLLDEDERVKDHMVKIFPKQNHGFAHIGLGSKAHDSGDDFERFVDEEFGGSGSLGFDGSDAEVACLLSTAWMETYSRVFLPTTGPAVSKDRKEAWSSIEMNNLEEGSRDVRKEMESALDNFVQEPLHAGTMIDQTDNSAESQEELARLLSAMQSESESGPSKIDPEDDLATIYAKLRASDDNFQIF